MSRDEVVAQAVMCHRPMIELKQSKGIPRI
jgi:hypothetical protein